MSELCTAQATSANGVPRAGTSSIAQYGRPSAQMCALLACRLPQQALCPGRQGEGQGAEDLGESHTVQAQHGLHTLSVRAKRAQRPVSSWRCLSSCAYQQQESARCLDVAGERSPACRCSTATWQRSWQMAACPRMASRAPPSLQLGLALLRASLAVCPPPLQKILCAFRSGTQVARPSCSWPQVSPICWLIGSLFCDNGHHIAGGPPCGWRCLA